MFMAARVTWGELSLYASMSGKFKRRGVIGHFLLWKGKSMRYKTLSICLFSYFTQTVFPTKWIKYTVEICFNTCHLKRCSHSTVGFIELPLMNNELSEAFKNQVDYWNRVFRQRETRTNQPSWVFRLRTTRLNELIRVVRWRTTRTS